MHIRISNTVFLGLLVASSSALPAQTLAGADSAPMRNELKNSHLLLKLQPQNLAAMDAPVQEQIREAESNVATAAALKSPDRGRAYGRLGQLYQAYDLRQAAIICYSNAETLEPTEFRWPYYLGYLFQVEGHFHRAIASYRTAMRLKPSDQFAVLRLADANLKLNSVDEAERLYGQALAQGKRTAPLLDGLGRVALVRRQFGKAAGYLTEALAIDPQAAYLHYPLAMAYRGLGQLEQARTELAKHGPAAPELVDPYLTEIQEAKKGKARLWTEASEQMALGNFSAAVVAYRKLLARDEDNLIARTYLGTALARAGDIEEAVRELQDVLRRSPAYAEAQYCLGVVLASSGRDLEAIPHLEAALKADLEFSEVHFQLANVLMRTGRYREAADQYAKAVDQQPRDAFASIMRAMALVRLDRYDEARSTLEIAHRALATNGDIASALARILAAAPDTKVRDGRRALELMQEVAKAGTIDADQAETIAMALAETGDFTRAIEIQRSLLQSQEQEDQARSTALRERLALYESRQACRTPWRNDDPIFVPIPERGNTIPRSEGAPATTQKPTTFSPQSSISAVTLSETSLSAKWTQGSRYLC